uniref:S100 calcium binding protein U n=2 Tax=Dicentrarchus labrax TaxID=13489 RepID=A0A8C4GSZ8_DICLA
MEAAICTLVTQFKTYAGKDGSSSTLSKDEFHNLVTSQLPNYVKNASDPGAIEQLMSSLDENNDGELTFSEFWQLIGKLASKQGGFKTGVMEAAIQTLVKVFLKSAKGKESLGKKEFQGLVKNQLSNILSDTDSKEAVNNMGQGLDADQDGKVGFEEYMKLVGYLAVSLSDQRNLAKEESAQNSASGQVAQSSAQDKEEKKPEANAGAKEEAKPEANVEAKAEATAEVKAEANADRKVELKVEANADPKVELKVDAKAEGATMPEAAKVEENPAAAAVVAAVEESASAVEVAVKEVVEETEKVEEDAEKLAAAVEEEVEKKIEEATS